MTVSLSGLQPQSNEQRYRKAYMTIRERTESRSTTTSYRLDGPLVDVLPRFNELVKNGARVECFAQMGREWKVVVEFPLEERTR